MGVFKNYFRHSLIRKYTIAFGTLFSNMEIARFDSDGKETGRIVCPISYSTKEKWLQRVISDPNFARQPSITLPRMAFEFVDMSYDGSRKLMKNFKVQSGKGAETVSTVYSPVPWNIFFNLYITTKTQEDMFQIIEQILPAFNPDVTIPFKSSSNLNLLYDVPLSLTNIVREDTFDSEIEEGRRIIWTLSFNMKSYLFGPVQNTSIIKQVIINVDTFDESKLARMEIEPYLDGKPVSEILPTDPWVPNVTIEEIFP